MWFNDESGSGKRLFWRRRKPRNQVMKVSLRAAARRGPGLPPPAALLTGLAGLVSAAVLLWFGGQWMEALLFSRNSTYTIAHLDIEGGGDLVTYFLREKKGIREGSNLFGFDLQAVRDEFFRQRFSARYRTMELTRLLPGTLKVSVVERVPVAQVGQSGGLMADAEGRVFGAGVLKHGLPAITGYGGGRLMPGDQLAAGARDAVTVIETCDKAGLSRDIMIESIDVRGGFAGKRDDMRMRLDGDVAVDLWWPRPGRRPGEAVEDLKNRLVFLRGVLNKARQSGLPLRKINLALENYSNNCPTSP